MLSFSYLDMVFILFEVLKNVKYSKKFRNSIQRFFKQQLKQYLFYSNYLKMFFLFLNLFMLIKINYVQLESISVN